MENGLEYQLRANSITDTYAIAGRIARHCFPGMVIALLGTLGAGKTTFVTGFCAELNIRAQVSSPTFTLINEYPGKIPVYHMDLYRLQDADSLWEIGLDDYLSGRGVTLIEWPQIALQMLPEDRLEVELAPWGENGRTLTVRGFGARYQAVVRELMA